MDFTKRGRVLSLYFYQINSTETEIMTKIPVLVIDDHAGFRRSVIHFLSSTSRFMVIGEAKNTVEGIALTHQHQPEVVLLDIRMPGETGLTIIEHLRKISPKLVIIVLTLWDSPEYRQAALIEKGADAYIIKEDMVSELLPTLDDLLSDSEVLSSSPLV